MRYIRLSPKNAALHNIYQYDTAGIFVDLDDDGIRELLGTHRCTSVSGMGDCLLYILKYDEGAKLKYKPISKGLYFDADSPIEILEDKSAGFHKIQVLSLKEHHPKILSFDKRKGVYVEKK